MPRYEVIHYPMYSVVIDHLDQRKIVYESQSLAKTRAMAKQLNREVSSDG